MLPSIPIRAIPPFKKGSTSTCYGSLQSKYEASEKAAGYFANSMPQNSRVKAKLVHPLHLPLKFLHWHAIPNKLLIQRLNTQIMLGDKPEPFTTASVCIGMCFFSFTSFQLVFQMEPSLEWWSQQVGRN